MPRRMGPGETEESGQLAWIWCDREGEPMRIVHPCWTAWMVAEVSESAYESQDRSSSHNFALCLLNPDESG